MIRYWTLQNKVSKQYVSVSTPPGILLFRTRRECRAYRRQFSFRNYAVVRVVITIEPDES